jgi:hypothetical protein
VVVGLGVLEEAKSNKTLGGVGFLGGTQVEKGREDRRRQKKRTEEEEEDERRERKRRERERG